MDDPIRTFSDEELEHMISRTYWQAAREYQEARSSQDRGDIRSILFAGAKSTEDHWRHLVAEADRRKSARIRKYPAQVSSAPAFVDADTANR